jgi:hypothetical protein
LLYLGPQDLRLREKIPADIALDVTYRKELQRGGAMIGFPNAASEASQEFDQEIVNSAADPLFSIPKQPEPDPKVTQRAVQDCLDTQEPQRTSIGRRAAATLSVLGSGTAALRSPQANGRMEGMRPLAT